MGVHRETTISGIKEGIAELETVSCGSCMREAICEKRYKNFDCADFLLAGIAKMQVQVLKKYLVKLEKQVSK
jgi:hypothetical protein